MKGMSVWVGVGNVGSVDEMRQTNDGKNILNFSVAVNRKHKGEDHTTWFRCVATGKTAEFVSQYVQKGTPVSVSGDLSLVEYAAKDGTKKSYLEVFTNNVVSLKAKEAEEVQGTVVKDSPF